MCPQPPGTHSSTSPSTAGSAIVLRGSPLIAHTHPPFTFPLSSDHLLHVIQYNVFRALVSNKRTFNTLFGDPTTCPLTWPCRDETTRYPLKSDIPASFVATIVQQTREHSTWININPFSRVRDNLIRREGHFDPWELMQDLVGELMNVMPAQRGRVTPVSSTVNEPRNSLRLPSGVDPDEITGGRNGLIVWGKPHEMQSWEATSGFLTKWAWAVEGCAELVEMSNSWRIRRGEEPMQFSVSRSYLQPPPFSHVAASGG